MKYFLFSQEEKLQGLFIIALGFKTRGGRELVLARQAKKYTLLVKETVKRTKCLSSESSVV